jgi:hypothetical protein
MYWLFHAAIFRRPRKLFLELLCRRTRLTAIFRSKAKLRPAVRSRTRQSSSRKVTSRTQCRLFSMLQCWRMALANISGASVQLDRK